jgi:hypothetical protein
VSRRRVTEPEPVELVGDTLFVDGEPVADLRQALRPSLRDRLLELLAMAADPSRSLDDDERDEAA